MALLVTLESVEGDKPLGAHTARVHHVLLGMALTDMPAH